MYIGDNHNPVQNGRCRNCDTIIDPQSGLVEVDEDGKLMKAQSFTCYQCDANFDCKYAWDWYNTNGDCLAEK
jgi:hypothetical protein